MHGLMCWRAHVERAYFLQNITDWVVYNSSVSACACGRTITLQERPESAVFFLRSTASTGPSCLSVGAYVHYL